MYSCVPQSISKLVLQHGVLACAQPRTVALHSGGTCLNSERERRRQRGSLQVRCQECACESIARAHCVNDLHIWRTSTEVLAIACYHTRPARAPRQDSSLAVPAQEQFKALWH